MGEREGDVCINRQGGGKKFGQTHLHIFQTVLLADTAKDILLAAFLHLASQ